MHLSSTSFRRALMAAPLILLSNLGQAAEMTIGAAGGWTWTDDLEMLGSTWNAAPRLTYHYDPNIGIESDIAIMSGETRIGQFPYLSVMPKVLLVGNLAPEEWVQPLLMFGPALWYKSTGDRGNIKANDRLGVDYVNPDVDFAGVFGPGVQLPLGESLVVRSDFRVVANFGTESYRNRGDAFMAWEWMTGIGFKIGGEPDTDKDGIGDETDQCPEVPEDIDQWADDDGCPEDDNDNDKIKDAVDECPNKAEDMDGFEDTNGCPEEDNDQDGLLDADDRCPNASGGQELKGCPDGDEDKIADIDDVCPEAKGDAALGGCPDSDKDGVADIDDACKDEEGTVAAWGCPDKDSDGIADKADECPDKPADKRINPLRSNGCLERAFFAADELILTDGVAFAAGKADLNAKAKKQLDQVVATLGKWGKEVTTLEIAVHTDGKGDADKNKKLSQDRAEAIATYLASKGVAEGKLKAVGYGDDKKMKEATVAFMVTGDDLKAKERKGQPKKEEKSGVPGK